MTAAFTIAAFSLPAWAASFWQEVARERATKPYASAQFLYAARPNISTCVAGTLTQQAKDRALKGMNRIRALHGLAPVRYSYLYDRSVQEAALIQAANGYPGHHPPPRARCYTTAGAQASTSSNLSRSTRSGRGRDDDPTAEMIGWTHDAQNDSLVAAAGHRRWMLNPFATHMSYGQVYGHTVQKVFDFDHEPALTPLITVDYVAFPYETYPAIFMADDPPWSFSVIENKRDRGGNRHPYFQLATVTVTRVSDGAHLPVGKLYMDTAWNGVPNFLSWQVEGWEFDTPYQITIRNVAMQSRKLRSYSYRVYIDRAGVHSAPSRTAQDHIRLKQEREELTFPARPQQVITREEREREARAAARAAKRFREQEKASRY